MSVYLDIFNNNPFPCFVFNEKGEVSFFNDAASSFLRNWNDDVQKLNEKNLRILLYQNNLSLQNIEVFVDKKYYRFEVVEIAKEKFAFYGFNVTFQKTTAETLFNLIDDVHEALFLVDVESEGSLVEVNSTATRYLGYSREELLMMNLSDIIENFPIDSRPDWNEHAMKVKTTENTMTKEVHLVRKDGTKFAAEMVLSIKKIMEKDYQLTLVRDITERLEEEKLKEELKIQMFATAKLSHLGEMATSVAHEINNPLTIIVAKAFDLKKMLQNNRIDIEKSLRAVDAIEKTVKRITKIISSLRNISKSLSEDSYCNEPIEEIINDVLNIYTERVKILNTKLTVTGKEKIEGKQIYCNKAQIAQALISVVNNSFDAVAKTEGSWIELVITLKDDAFVVISVIDSGMGIISMNVEEIFEPFYSTKPLGHGKGLGLAIARSVLQKHGGLLEYDQSSKNTCFKFFLPVQEAS